MIGKTRRWMVLGVGSAALSFACGDDGAGGGGSGGGGAPPSPVEYGPMGSLVAEEGRGSFRFGAATAATQIEDQNENTDWFVFTSPTEQGGLGKGKAPVGDASNGFTRALEDVSLLTETGLDSYRFSIEWARIEPQRDMVDEDALAHYDALLDAIIAAGVRPMITLHHFSNPVWVGDPRDMECAGGPTDQNLCGFGHPMGKEEIVAEFSEHVALLAERFGDRVDEWGTVNEPVNYLLAAYGVGTFPPGMSTILTAEGLLNEFMPIVETYLRMHAGAYAALKDGDTVDADGDGSAADVGFTLSVADWEPARDNLPSDDPEDLSARDRVVYVYHRLFLDAALTGEFDSDLDGEVDSPVAGLANTVDWLGVQYYFRAGVTGKNPLLPVVAVTPCFAQFDFGACLEPVNADTTKCVPSMKYEFYEEGLYRVLADYAERYPELPLLVSESGLATEVGKRRAEHVVRSLEQIDRAVSEGADVRGYYHWSLFDNFEWVEGFEPRFGLFTVDFGTFERTATEGAVVLGDVAKARLLTTEQRTEYGGLGPMTPEEGAVLGTRCNQ
jgi:beta-glucosidase/6-phospho-beta-glucosidase/beta-galactosidase